MKILFNDVIQYSDAPKELKSPALSDRLNFGHQFVVNLDRRYPINCVGIGNTNAEKTRIYLAEPETVIGGGQLWAWGWNGVGQLGNGNTATQRMPIRIGGDATWKEIYAGHEHTLALRVDGSLWACGNNASGRTGLGGSGGFAVNPVRIGSFLWNSASTDNSHSMAIRNDGSLWGWGNNGNGRIGDGTTSQRNSPVRIGADNDWSQVSAGNQHTIALKENGTLWAWGNNADGRTGLGTSEGFTLEPTRVGTDADWSMIYTKGSHCLALKTNGTLWSWGTNANGRTGLGINTGVTLVPTQVGSDADWAQISIGQTHSLAIKNNNTLWTWGSNLEGRTGQGFITGNIVVPMRVGADVDWAKASAGEMHTVALKMDGTIWVCGSNGTGQLGIPEIIINSPTMIQSGTSSWKFVSAGRFHTHCIRDTGGIHLIDWVDIDFDGNGLYCFDRTVNASIIIINTEIDTFIGRFAAGRYCDIPTAIAKEPGFNSTNAPRVTLSGQVIQGLGGYNFRTVSLDSRYKIDESTMNDIKEGYKHIAMGYPFFIDLSRESYKLPFDRLYANDANQQQLRFESGVRRYLYSRRWQFEERF